MTTSKDFDEVFAEGETAAKPVNPVFALREAREARDAEVRGQFLAEFDSDGTTPPATTPAATPAAETTPPAEGKDKEAK